MQNALTAVVILGAVAYLVWRWRVSRRQKAACGACAHASTSAASGSKEPAR